MQIISSELHGFKYSWLILMIIWLLSNYFYLIIVICEDIVILFQVINKSF